MAYLPVRTGDDFYKLGKMVKYHTSVPLAVEEIADTQYTKSKDR